MDEEYSLGEPASDFYDRLVGERTAVVDLAREMAELTIPSVFPPETYKAGDHLPGNNQSIGARCVNNLASRLMFMGFPPGRPMLRFEPIEHKLGDDIKKDPELWSKVKLALSRKEIEHRRVATTTTLASNYVGFIKQLLVAGNCLWRHMDLETPTYRRCDTYVVQRDANCFPLVTVLKETLKLASLDDDLKEHVLASKAELRDLPEWSVDVDIYCVLKLKVSGKEKSWLYWEEFEGDPIDGTEYEADFDDPPMYPHGLIPVPGSNWMRSYCEEYRGDLYLVENHASAINDGSSVAALSLLFVKPNSRTSLKQVREAKNLDVLPGAAEDVTAFRFDKGGDFQFVANNLDAAAKRLAFAFLLNSAIQRDAERVTKEEWVQMGRELDEAMGGLYTELAQGAQRHVVLRFVRLHEDSDKSLPKLPKDVIRVSPVTGLDALGATTEEEGLVSLTATIRDIYGPEVLAKTTNPVDFVRRLAAEKGVQPEGLLKDEQQIATEDQANQQLQQQATLLDKGTAPAIKAMGDSLMQQQPQPPG
jgi:hypothetical protein